MKNIFFKTSILLVTSVLFFSCASKNGDKNIKETIIYPDGIWELAEITSVKNINNEFPNKLPTLIFENNNNFKAFGNDGCNRYDINLSIKSKNKIKISSEINTTKMFCNDVNSELYLKTLTEANSYHLSKNILKINTQTDTLKFYKVSLDGKWFLSKINTTKKKFDDLYPYKKPFITIDINSNQISGFTACNSINANILIFQNTMKFDNVTSTKMFCDGTGEKELTNALTKVTNFELKGTKLILLEKNKIILEFKRQYE